MASTAVSMSSYGLSVLSQLPPADVRVVDSRTVLICVFFA